MGYVGRSEVNVFRIASQSILLLTIDYLNGLSLFIRFFLGGAEESTSGFCCCWRREDSPDGGGPGGGAAQT